MRKFIARFIARLVFPKICQVGDVILTRDGKAYWVQPGELRQMRVVSIHQIKETE